MERRQLDFQSFNEVLSDIDGLHAGGYHQLGNWDLAENLEHLRLTMESATEEKDLGIPKPIRWVLRKLFLGTILGRRRMKSGLRTAKGLIPKQSNRQKSEAKEAEAREIEAFRATIEAFKNHSGDYHSNPAFGSLSREDWTELQKVHCSHHLSFLVPID